MVVLLAFVFGAHVEMLSATHIEDSAQDTLAADNIRGKKSTVSTLLDNLVNKLDDRLMDKPLTQEMKEKVLQKIEALKVSGPDHKDVMRTTTGKPGNPVIPSNNNVPSWKFDSPENPSAAQRLQQLYMKKLLPLEKLSQFEEFHSPELTDADFGSRPMVLLVGQYSTGKSTFIRHLLQRDYPGIRIAPEPTTDKFVCVTWGESDQVIPGHAFVHDTSLPFTQLSRFGKTFLTRFEAAKLNSTVLGGVTFIDTPGVLAGDKQATKRGYDFEGVMKWFAERVDMILLMFDAHKLDISDEFNRCIRALKGNDHKIHIILNKADQVTAEQLMRVYGALMWSLSKIVDTPEVIRVYVGSFWDRPLQNEALRKQFEQEEQDLYKNIAELPRYSSWRKVNDVIKRARLAKIHALLLSHLRRTIPYFGKTAAKARTIDDLPGMYWKVAKQHNVPLGDFPPVQNMQEKLKDHDFTMLPPLDMSKLRALESLLSKDIPALLKDMPAEWNGSRDHLANKLTNHGGKLSLLVLLMAFLLHKYSYCVWHYTQPHAIKALQILHEVVFPLSDWSLRMRQSFLLLKKCTFYTKELFNLILKKWIK